MKIASIVGARPQFIKLAPLSKKIKKRFKEIIFHTGQHFDKEMSDNFFADLNIALPDYNLNINKGNHGEQTGRMLIELERVILSERPDLIIVFGDTNTTLAGSLVASKIRIPVVHVEAGLRSFNHDMPEEINRIVADHCADYLFAPTETAMNNLRNENLGEKSYFTGDIMVDSLNDAKNSIRNFKHKAKYNLQIANYYLVTLHRPYNVDNPEKLRTIINQLGKLSKDVIFPIHPRTRTIINKHNLKVAKNIKLISPVGYLDFINLQLNALKIITDSGGIQKEAYILKKPCITLRTETEWLETINAGWNLLLNPNTENSLVDKIESFEPPQQYQQIFGENVADKMTTIINNIKQ